jgi:immunity protein, SdpI family
MPKPWGFIIVPLVMALRWLLFIVLPRISPRGFEMDSFARAWGILTVAVLAFMLFVEILTLNAARTAATLSPRLIFAGIGVLFAVIGGVLGKVTRNFLAGIRTPWTLASEEVWNRAHRLAGRLFVAAGLVVVAAALLGLGWWTMIAALALGALVPVIYSYVIYRRLEGFPAGQS